MTMTHNTLNKNNILAKMRQNSAHLRNRHEIRATFDTLNREEAYDKKKQLEDENLPTPIFLMSLKPGHYARKHKNTFVSYHSPTHFAPAGYKVGQKKQLRTYEEMLAFFLTL